MEDILNKNSSA